jgi:hypothetical protein
MNLKVLKDIKENGQNSYIVKSYLYLSIDSKITL